MFGSYVEAYDEPTSINDITHWNHACMALGPSGNIKGSQKVFDIHTGKVLM